MTELPYDFAVIGSTPLAKLLAGLLVQVHGRRVVLLAETTSPFRLARGFDLSVAPLTRPDSWALLKRTTPELLRLLHEIARGMVRRLDPQLVAATPAGADALAHVRQVAAGFGLIVERIAGRAAAVYRFRDAALLDRQRLGPALTAWCDRLGVRRPAAPAVAIRRDGSVRIDVPAATIEAAHTILADDDAIVRYLRGARPDWLRIQPATSLLTQPARALPAPLVMHVDAVVVLAQSSGGAIAALSPGSRPEALPRIGAALAAFGQVRRAGQVEFATAATLDGGGVVGAARSMRVSVIAGLGASGAFMVPALARFFAGVATEDEARYFAARQPARTRHGAAEYIAAPVPGTAA